MHQSHLVGFCYLECSQIKRKMLKKKKTTKSHKESGKRSPTCHNNCFIQFLLHICPLFWFEFKKDLNVVGSPLAKNLAASLVSLGLCVSKSFVLIAKNKMFRLFQFQ